MPKYFGVIPIREKNDEKHRSRPHGPEHHLTLLMVFTF